jgi:hypothetical protein
MHKFNRIGVSLDFFERRRKRERELNRRKNVLDFFHVYLFSILLNLTNTKKMRLVDLKKVTVDC